MAKQFQFSELRDEYSKLVKEMEVRPERKDALAKVAAKITANEELYKQVMARTTVPWQVVGIIHSLEAGCDTSLHLHNGDPLADRTKRVPSGRPLTGNPPFKWADSAVDALTMPNHELHTVGDWPTERIAFELERYNGWGYRREHPEVKSPYLWSFTNHFTKGKFIRDHEFDANAPSDQAGGMALLKFLVDAGSKIESVASTDVAKTVPIQSDLFLAEGPFELLPTATSKPSDDPDIVEEDEPVRKLGEALPLWQIEIQTRTPKKVGFARGGLFHPITPSADFDVDAFAQLCLNAARFAGTSAHHLVALADVETGIRNVAAAAGDGAGPFLIKAKDWDAAIADGSLGLNAKRRFDPLAHPFVAAKMATASAAALKPAMPDRLPTSAELYIAHLVGADSAAKIIGKPASSLQDAITAEVGADEFKALSGLRPWLFAAGIDVKSALEKIARRMDFGYARADGLFRKVEPDFDTATSSGFAAKLRDKATEQWRFFGGQAFNASGTKVSSGHAENEPGFFERIGTYWRVVGDLSSDGRTNKAWSAAFISFCIKGCGAANKFHESPQHSVYISQAIRDFNDKADVAYWCQRLKDHKPVVGDVLCWTREEGVDYDHQKGGDYKGHCDIVVEARADEIDVIGGNVGQSVSKRTLPLDATGFLKPITMHGETLFAIMENKLP